MATDEHKRLANIVKSTHAQLRADCRHYGAETTWARHVARDDVLQEYAASMRKLATECWEDGNSISRNGTHCRMEWIKTRCKDYFFNGGREKYDQRERDIIARMSLKADKSSDERSPILADDSVGERDNSPDAPKRRISLLDVGSCYNPLGGEDAFDVIAIDLVPATDEVLRCDFLNVAVGDERVLSWEAREIQQLAVNSYDAVIFSLLLEYLPCPTQRYICCEKAYNVLKSGGMLVIVSPDSKHVGANASLMRSWRYALSRLGFMRVAYEKLRHVHCLAFRKCARKDVAARWADLQQRSSSSADDERYAREAKIFIPQDFQNGSPNEKQESAGGKYDEVDLASSFSELPFSDEIL